MGGGEGGGQRVAGGKATGDKPEAVGRLEGAPLSASTVEAGLRDQVGASEVPPGPLFVAALVVTGGQAASYPPPPRVSSRRP